MNTTRVSLLRRVRDLANGEAWSEFVAIYAPLLKRYARMRGLGEADAEDVAQQCLTQIVRKIPGFEYDPRRGRFRGWLRKTVERRIIDLLRRGRVQLADEGDLERPQQREPSPEEAWEQAWLETHLKQCLRQIQAEVAPHTYEAFYRTAMEDQPMQEVAAALGLTLNQVYVARSRITQRLHDRMHALVAESNE